MSLTPIEEEIAAILGFNAEICEYIKRNLGDRPLERALCFDSDYKLVNCNGITVVAPTADINAFLSAHRSHLVQQGYRPYLSTRTQDNRGNGEVLVILHTDDPYEIVRQQKTSGPNYDVSNEDVLAKLKEWESLCRFEIVQVEPDTLVLNLVTLPKNLCSFAEDVYAFCPDTVDQGVGNMQEDDFPEVFTAARALCPGSATKAVASALSRVVPDEDELFAGEFAASAEMGVKLLAYSFHEARQVYLWWD